MQCSGAILVTKLKNKEESFNLLHAKNKTTATELTIRLDRY